MKQSKFNQRIDIIGLIFVVIEYCIFYSLDREPIDYALYSLRIYLLIMIALFIIPILHNQSDKKVKLTYIIFEVVILIGVIVSFMF
ncbi:MAG: hypothetical protein Q4F05_09975 [bacterium]|nr:hypothetical protein [bacterium]